MAERLIHPVVRPKGLAVAVAVKAQPVALHPLVLVVLAVQVLPMILPAQVFSTRAVAVVHKTAAPLRLAVQVLVVLAVLPQWAETQLRTEALVVAVAESAGPHKRVAMVRLVL
jgi:hypothetical protein